MSVLPPDFPHVPLKMMDPSMLVFDLDHQADDPQSLVPRVLGDEVDPTGSAVEAVVMI